MREIMNAYKGIKEPMHVIMEEEEMYEASFIEMPHGISYNEDTEQDDEREGGLLMTPSKERSFNIGSEIGTPMSGTTQFTIGSPGSGAEKEENTPHFDYNEPGQKEGRLLFNVLRGEIIKAFNLKSEAKADAYLDRITFIARKMINIWFGHEITVENFNMFVDLFQEKAYLLSFQVMLESFRKMNCFELDPKGYEPFCELMLACLTQVRLSLPSLQ